MQFVFGLLQLSSQLLAFYHKVLRGYIFLWVSSKHIGFLYDRFLTVEIMTYSKQFSGTDRADRFRACSMLTFRPHELRSYLHGA